MAKRPVAAGWGRRSVRGVWNALLIVGFYVAYAVIRNSQGGRISPAQEARALGHGLAVLDLEQRLGLDHETTIQGLFLRVPVLMKASNIFYATAHFTVTAGVLLAPTVAGGRRHARWRNILGLATAVALVGFAVYPTMPPRLLPDHPALIDTLSVVGAHPVLAAVLAEGRFTQLVHDDEPGNGGLLQHGQRRPLSRPVDDLHVARRCRNGRVRRRNRGRCWHSWLLRRGDGTWGLPLRQPARLTQRLDVQRQVASSPISPVRTRRR